MVNIHKTRLIAVYLLVASTTLVPTRANALDPITIAAVLGIAAGCSWGTGYIVDRWYPEWQYPNKRAPYRPVQVEKVDTDEIEKDFEKSFEQVEKEVGSNESFQFIKKYKIGRGPRLSFQQCGPFALPVIELPYQAEIRKKIYCPTKTETSLTVTEKPNGSITILKESRSTYSKDDEITSQE